MEIITNGVLVSIIAHGLIGLSLIWDKVLLRQPETKNLISYVFWLGSLSVFGLVLIPFGYESPGWGLALFAVGTGVLELLSNYFYYAALKAGEASETLAVMGGFSPLATVLFGVALLAEPLAGESVLGFVLLVLGGFVMFAAENMDVRALLPMVLLASVSFGLTNVLEKIVFNRTNFVTGFVLLTIGTFAGSMGLLIRRSWRVQIIESSGGASPRNKAAYMTNRVAAGFGSFLIFYAISRTSPAVVDAISGLRYALVFVVAWTLTRFKPGWLVEDFGRRVVLMKTGATVLVIAGLVLLAAGASLDSGASAGP
ncbi:MAG: EamA family transporter [bacterium]|jgi:uncharacterized membrane protein